jgi:hypothetical protein
MAGRLGMKLGVLRYYLDELKKAGFARYGGSTFGGGEYWALKDDGRKYVMESVSQETLRRCALTG